MNISKISNNFVRTASTALLAGLMLAGCSEFDTDTTPIATPSQKTASTPGPINTNNWYTQNIYWQQHYTLRPYYQSGVPYSTYQPAYQFGFLAYTQYNRRPYNQVQSQLESNWNSLSGVSTLTWAQAQPAVMDSYNRMYDNQGAPPQDTESTTAGAGNTGKNAYNSGAAAGVTLGR